MTYLETLRPTNTMKTDLKNIGNTFFKAQNMRMFYLAKQAMRDRYLDHAKLSYFMCRNYKRKPIVSWVPFDENMNINKPFVLMVNTSILDTNKGGK
jgi:hypothetical protein